MLSFMLAGIFGKWRITDYSVFCDLFAHVYGFMVLFVENTKLLDYYSAP